MVYEAKLADLQTVKNMVHRTIKECYPECFSENVVDFFLNLHSEEAIKDDLINANVYLMESDGYLAQEQSKIMSLNVCLSCLSISTISLVLNYYNVLKMNWQSMISLLLQWTLMSR